MLEFLEESGFDSARVDLLEQMERYAAAAELSLQEGNPLEAVRLFTRAGDSDSYQRAAQTILRGLWSELPLGATNPTKGTSRKLLELGQSLVTLLVEQRTEVSYVSVMGEVVNSHVEWFVSWTCSTLSSAPIRAACCQWVKPNI
jgi:hypothetical protein